MAATEIDTTETVPLTESENRQIFDWIEGMIGPHFTTTNKDSDGKVKKFSLVEFELGKDDQSKDDLLRCTLGEGMIVPLRVVYKLDDELKTNQLLVRLPTYFFDFAEDINDNETTIITVHTHETYFYSTVLRDIEDFIQSEGLSIKLAIPECFYVKHHPKYEMRKTPALIDNILETHSLLILEDLKADGFEELESVEDVDLQEGVAVITQIAKIHAVTWAMEQKTGKKLSDMWSSLLRVTEQAINDHVIEGSFEFFAQSFDGVDQNEDDWKMYCELVSSRPKIEKIVKDTLYSTGPDIPNSLLHMMIGGPNLFFRKDVGQTNKSNSYSNEDINVFISSWNLCAIGNPILDIALFSCISLVSEVRQRCNDIFLEQYWQIFMSTANKFKLKPQFDYEYVCKEFEKFQIWCFLFMVAACNQDDMKIEETREILKSILQLLPKISID